MAMAQLCNLWTSKGHRFSIEDFLPHVAGVEPEAQSPEEGQAIMRGLAARMRALANR